MNKRELKEKIGISCTGVVILSVNLFMFCHGFPSMRLLLPAAVGLGFIILPWVRERMIQGGVIGIELWETDENGKRLKLLRELSEEERKTICRTFRKYPHKIKKTTDEKLACAGIALRIIYKKQRQTIFLSKENSRCFIMRDKKTGIILKEGEAQKVSNIILMGINA